MVRDEVFFRKKKKAYWYLDDSLLSSFSSASQFLALGSCDPVSTKQSNYAPVKSYADLLQDDDEFSLINECDVQS